MLKKYIDLISEPAEMPVKFSVQVLEVEFRYRSQRPISLSDDTINNLAVIISDKIQLNPGDGHSNVQEMWDGESIFPIVLENTETIIKRRLSTV